MREKKIFLIGAMVMVLFWVLLMAPAFSAPKLPSIIGIGTIGVGTASHTATVSYAPYLKNI